MYYYLRVIAITLRLLTGVGGPVEVFAVRGQAVALPQKLRHGGGWSLPQLPQGPCRRALQPIKPPVKGW